VLSQPRISSIEKRLDAAMRKVGLYPIPQYVIGPYITDFAFVDQCLAIECDGDYWHSLPKQQVRDRQKDNYLKRSHWYVLRLPEHRILSNIDECIQEIISFLNNIA
jgi:very-short-patch-repair endonuclease